MVNSDQNNVQAFIQKQVVPLSTPKLLVLVSMYPVYNQMKVFLTKLKDQIMRATVCPVENLLINLIYEFPHPGEKYEVVSNFWNSASSTIFNHPKKRFKYEDYTYLRYCDYANFKTFQRVFQDRYDKMWQVIENMLLGLSIVLVSDSSEKLVKVIEVFRSLIYPYVYQGVIFPYDPNPNQNLIMSEFPYLLGKTA